ncbi:MAG: hypothetical protein P8M78_04060, partial [Myxococcota bacterium]|nr:hypothetical protein [Myxococcota bacterium]
GFPALAISQYVARHRQPDWDKTRQRARPLLQALLERPPGPGAFWNINLPDPAEHTGPCPVIHCEPDPSPHPVQYDVRGEHYDYSGDFHARPRLPDHDVDVCFGGRIAVSWVPLSPSSSAAPVPGTTASKGSSEDS